MDRSPSSSREIVERLGGHPAAACGIELAADAGAAHWFALCCLLSGRVDESVARRAYGALAREGWAAPDAIARRQAAELAGALAAAGYPRPEPAAARLRRACAALVERHGGSPAAIAAEAADTPDLAERLVRLAPGVGPATALRFLRPLRDLWPAAREVPLAPAARAAAVHLGWLRPGQDEEGEPGALRAALAAQADAPALADVEAALERLGARACLRERPDRCPLGDACPAASGTAG